MKLRMLCPMSSGFVIYTVVNIFRQETDRTISLIDEHSYEAVQPPRKIAQRGVPTYSKLCLNHNPQFIIVFHTSKDSNFAYSNLIYRRLFVCIFFVCCGVYVQLKNSSLIWRHHRLNFLPIHSTHEGSLAYNTYC